MEPVDIDGVIQQGVNFAPPPSPLYPYPLTQTAAANQQPLLIVYKQNIVRPAAFKYSCSPVMTRSDQRQTAITAPPTPPPKNYTKTYTTRTFRRMDSIRRRDSVCRSLFGPVDHEQLRRDLKLRLKEIAEEDSRRWNFNFQTDTPLPGRFEWEEIPTDRAAALYQDSAPLQDAVCSSNTEEEDDRLSDREGGAETDQENCSRISNTHKCPAEVTPVRRKRKLTKPAAKPGNNARITGEDQSTDS